MSKINRKYSRNFIFLLLTTWFQSVKLAKISHFKARPKQGTQRRAEMKYYLQGNIKLKYWQEAQHCVWHERTIKHWKECHHWMGGDIWSKVFSLHARRLPQTANMKLIKMNTKYMYMYSHKKNYCAKLHIRWRKQQPTRMPCFSTFQSHSHHLDSICSTFQDRSNRESKWTSY